MCNTQIAFTVAFSSPGNSPVAVSEGSTGDTPRNDFSDKKRILPTNESHPRMLKLQHTDI
jgi:hypothetical protein